MQWFWGPVAVDECPQPWVGAAQQPEHRWSQGALNTCWVVAGDAGAWLGVSTGLGSSSACAHLCLAQAGNTPYL